jgi:hypothetical protein
MKRRSFLLGTAGAAVSLLAPRSGRAQSALRLGVAYEDPGQAIAPDFIGLSYESAILAAGGYLTPENSSTLGLIRSLGGNGVIRIGGNTSERTIWNPDAMSPSPTAVAITPRNIDRLAAALRLLGWKLIYGLNLARGTPADAADEAAYVANAVGSNLLAFQIGNEPDGFGRWTAVRPKSYDVTAYLAEWRRFHASIRAKVPGGFFAGPDVADATDWVAALAEARPERLVLLTHHYYADGPAGAPYLSLAKLLHDDGRTAPLLQRLARYSRSYRLPFRITETNSIYGEGQPGISDTLGAALWGLELMFQAATAGADGINFHGGAHNRRPAEDKAYTPIGRSGNGRHRAAPLYYSMVMFARAARGALVPTYLVPDLNHLKAFAVRAPEGTLQVCLLNKSSTRGEGVEIDPGRRFSVASIRRLAGPALDATTGVTLSGASIDEFGKWAPATIDEVQLTSRAVLVEVPAASAALISMHE